MARPRKPTNVLELKGAFKKDPQRGASRENEPEAAGEIGDPPERLTEFERECWRDLVSLCHAGVLCAADRLFVEYGARVLAQLRSATEIDPKLGIRFETVCARLGMTPSDRSKVQAVKPKEDENPFAKFKPAG
jgi:phage terminase small subunit